ncbi:MAG: nitrate/nitrite transporter NrtS [Pseudolabrys sp.]|nr:nitrate/nitrite transporter NrtS [Pseudolabrys sp.]
MQHTSTFNLACRYMVSDGIPIRSLWVAIVVGTVLNLINQGDALLGMMPLNWTKILLTYFVPYAVSTYGAVSYRLACRLPEPSLSASNEDRK